MQTEVIVLGAAVVAEAVAVVGLLTGMLRLRARIDGMGARADARGGASVEEAREAVGQLRALVDEASALGDMLARRLMDLMERHDALAVAPMVPADRVAMESTPGGKAPTTPALPPWNDVGVEGKKPEPITEAEAVAAARAESDGARAPRMGLAASGLGDDAETDAAITTMTSADAALARQKGMDPLGVALQRSLAAQAGRRDARRA